MMPSASRFLALSLTLAAVLAVAGCSGSRDAGPKGGTTPAAQPTIVDKSQSGARKDSKDDRATPRPGLDPAQFKGLTPTEIERRLGQPAFRQRESFAEVWQYLSGPCVLYLYLYRPENSRPDAPFRVEKGRVEVRETAGSDNLRPEQVCATAFSDQQTAPAPAGRRR